MDCVAKLAAEAKHCLWEEKWDRPKDWADARKHTREYLAGVAHELGFQENEISAAVDEALTAAGTTP
jgi:hypothetical protein